MRSPYKAKRCKDRLGPRDAVLLHLGTSDADEGLYPVPKANRARLGSGFNGAIVDAK